MTKITFPLAIQITLLSAILFGCSGKDTFTEQDVRAFFQEMSQAINAKDTDKVLSGISENVEINLTMMSPEGNQEMNMGKAQYEKNMRQTFEVAESYQYHIDKMEIELAADGLSAVVKTKTHEEITAQGQTLSAVSKGESELRMIDGRLQAVRIDGVVIMQQ